MVSVMGESIESNDDFRTGESMASYSGTGPCPGVSGRHAAPFAAKGVGGSR